MRLPCRTTMGKFNSTRSPDEVATPFMHRSSLAVSSSPKGRFIVCFSKAVLSLRGGFRSLRSVPVPDRSEAFFAFVDPDAPLVGVRKLRTAI